ncbi:MAG: tRNA (cytidine(34)-2'-O)-methyltransferase [Aeromonadales bacterium]|nr:tRNA (cytidine(34)-2'-O)-methyltransferase [Aeromonadales bacterium]MDY2890866.1 tRNA (cytidine(34)-2'-O)-methyltransferase [Succinivibrio sp.]
MIDIVLYRPEMPGNAGNIMRLCVNFGARLHMIGPMAFVMDDARLRRAGLDYREIVNVTVHVNLKSFMERERPRRLVAATAHGHSSLKSFKFQDGDYVIFGREKEGLSAEVYALVPPELRVRIPMVGGSRCMNLSNSVAVVSYEAWRQEGFLGAVPARD